MNTLGILEDNVPSLNLKNFTEKGNNNLTSVFGKKYGKKAVKTNLKVSIVF